MSKSESRAGSGKATTHARRAMAVLGVLGVILLAGTAWALNCNVGTFVFYPGGGIKSCELNGNHQFWTKLGKSVTCVDGEILTQHPDGGVESCAIGQPHAFGEDRCAPGRIVFHPDGRVRSCIQD